MKTKTQYDRLARLLTRKGGCTALQIIEAVGTTSPHSRLAEMKSKGWVIMRRAVPKKTYGYYVGLPPTDLCGGF